jgi:hypothetical protein
MAVIVPRQTDWPIGRRVCGGRRRKKNT